MKKIILALAILNICAYLVTIVACGKKSSDPCSGVTCNNGGTCNSGKCNCAAGWGGPTCDSCTVGCTNKCVNGSCYCGTCACSNGYLGAKCDSTWVSVFLGSFSQTDSCGTKSNFKTSGSIPSSITQIDATHFNISNLYNVNLTGKFNMTSKTQFTMDSLKGTYAGQTFKIYARGTGTCSKNKNGTKTLRIPVLIYIPIVPEHDTCILNFTN